MKNLLFFTNHKQYLCFNVWNRIFERNSFIRGFDVVICNDSGFDESNKIKEITKYFPNKPKIITFQKPHGYILGLFKDLAYCYPILKKYKYVFHIHPDVYISDDSALSAICKEEIDTDVCILSSFWTKDRNKCNTDFFIIKPALLHENIFALAEKKLDELPEENKNAETILYNLILDGGIKLKTLERYENNIMTQEQQRSVDKLKLIHYHGNPSDVLKEIK